MALLEIHDLKVDLPSRDTLVHAVRSVSFSVERGETLGIVGESGCGKSMTLFALMNLLPRGARRTAQRMQFAGEDLLGASSKTIADIRGNRMAMVFQEPMTSLNPAFTIGNQLCEALRRHKPVSRSEAEDRAVYLLEKVGIAGAADRMQRYPHQLSGGLRQRVMIAMALMCGPDLIIADEPTTALDVTVQAQILRLLADLRRELNMSMVIVTHDLGVIARTTDKVAVMYAGEIVEQGLTREIFARPLHPYTRALLDCVPKPGRRERNARLGAIPGSVPSLAGPLLGCAFRARCRHARAECAEHDIAIKQAPSGQNYRCILETEEMAS